MELINPADMLHFGELGFAALTMLTAFWYIGSATNRQTDSIVGALKEVKDTVKEGNDKNSSRYEQLLMALNPAVFGRGNGDGNGVKLAVIKPAEKDSILVTAEKG